MKPVRPELVPDEPPPVEEMRAIQSAVKGASIEDVPEPYDPETDLIAGIDQAFDSGRATSAVVVWHDGTVIEEVTATVELRYPYVSGLLAFREAPAILAALRTLSVEPDVLLLDGNGRIHPHEAGLATHVGVAMDWPTIGVAKNLLCGELEDPPPFPFPEGTRVPIRDGDRLLGYAVQTRQWDRPNRHINPVYVSPGHRMDAETAVDVVLGCVRGYKLPEPIRLADRLAAERTGTG